MTKKQKTDIIKAVIAALAVIIAAYWQFVWKPPKEEKQLEYFGRVIDSATEAPISGAQVSLDFQDAPPVVYTDNQGIFRFTISLDGPSSTGRVRIDVRDWAPNYRIVELSRAHPELAQPRQSPSRKLVQAETRLLTSLGTPLVDIRHTDERVAGQS